MIILPLQYDNHRGPDAIGQHKLTFTMDESVSPDFNPMSIKKGTQFMVMMIEVNTDEFKTFEEETPAETKERFRKHMNALINKIAELRGIDPKIYREEFKTLLKAHKVIRESTKELDLQGYALAIAKLNETLNDLQ